MIVIRRLPPADCHRANGNESGYTLYLATQMAPYFYFFITSFHSYSEPVLSKHTQSIMTVTKLITEHRYSNCREPRLGDPAQDRWQVRWEVSGRGIWGREGRAPVEEEKRRKEPVDDRDRGGMGGNRKGKSNIRNKKTRIETERNVSRIMITGGASLKRRMQMYGRHEDMMDSMGTLR
jgi:hypothetical protein